MLGVLSGCADAKDGTGALGKAKLSLGYYASFRMGFADREVDIDDSLARVFS